MYKTANFLLLPLWLLLFCFYLPIPSSPFFALLPFFLFFFFLFFFSFIIIAIVIFLILTPLLLQLLLHSTTLMIEITEMDLEIKHARRKLLIPRLP